MSNKPYKIQLKETEQVRKQLAKVRLYPHSSKYEVYVTDTVCGRCYYKKKCITIPLWALGGEGYKRGGFRYVEYYASHEFSHATVGYQKGTPHGKDFMKAFMSICPEELQYLELRYKPHNAAVAGISK